MKTLIRKMALALGATLTLTLTALLSPALAAGGGIAWDKFPDKRVTDMAALQNGAKLFVNYCLNCHQAAFMRFNRLRDIGLTEQQIKDNLVFTGAKVGETMKVALDAKDAKEWFGALPPDLTLVARSRSASGQGSGADYIYTYLRTYYRDETKVTGWNNLAFPNVGMPHVLWELQGQQKAIYADEKDPHDPTKTVHVFKGFEQSHPRHPEPGGVQPGGGRPGGLPEMDERTQPERARAPGRVGADLPGGIHRHRLAPERGVLEGHQVVSGAARPPGRARERSGARRARCVCCFSGAPCGPT